MGHCTQKRTNWQLFFLSPLIFFTFFFFYFFCAIMKVSLMIAMATAMVAIQTISANETYVFSDNVKRRFFVIVRQNVSFDEARELCRQKEIYKSYKMYLALLWDDDEFKSVTDYMHLRERLWVNAKAACNEGIENCEIKDSTYGRQWDYRWISKYYKPKIQSKFQKRKDEKTGNGICGICPEYGTYIGIYKGTSEDDLTFSNYKKEEKMGFICKFNGLPEPRGNQFASEMADEQ